jgi:hypothetical protein
MPCHAMHPMQDYFWKVFHKYYNLICILYALLFAQKFLFLQKVGVTGVLEVYDHVGALIHQLTRRVQLLRNLVPCVLGITEATVHDLQLLVLV